MLERSSIIEVWRYVNVDYPRSTAQEADGIGVEPHESMKGEDDG
jgi:hypothetical protein